MGAVYLAYSAYYVCINIDGMRIFISVRNCIFDFSLVFIEHTLFDPLYCFCEEYGRS